MSNPAFPSCLLPSAKYGWGHTVCGLLCRPDGSWKIERFCPPKHQLFSKISISWCIAAGLALPRAKRCRPCSTAQATCWHGCGAECLQLAQGLGQATEMLTLLLLMDPGCRALAQKASPVPEGTVLSPLFGHSSRQCCDNGDTKRSFSPVRCLGRQSVKTSVKMQSWVINE